MNNPENQSATGDTATGVNTSTTAPASKQYLMRFFAYEHLPAHLQEISKPFGELAKVLDDVLPENPEKSTAFRKLLEAKDCAVRASLPGGEAAAARGTA